MARSEIGLASLLHKKRLQKFKSADTLRQGLIRQIHALRRVREQGIVTHFSGHDFDADVMQFVKIGHGSMGGKALGLAFMASQLKKNSWLQAWRQAAPAAGLTAVFRSGVSGRRVKLTDTVIV